jgi:hypothetical protein
MDRRQRESSTTNLLSAPRRLLRRLSRWLPAVLLVIFLFGSGYAFPPPEEVKEVLRIHPSMNSETVPRTQQADIGGSSAKEANGSSKDAGNASTTETANVYAATTSTKVSEQLANVPQRVYVPNVGDGTMAPRKGRNANLSSRM